MNEEAAAASGTGALRRDDSVAAALKSVPQRKVIWVLLSALIAVILWIGGKYNDRLEALEDYKRQQNGHLKHIGERLGVVENNVDWIKRAIERLEKR